MLWFLNRFKGSEGAKSPTRGTIEAIYGTIVAQAREPVFYATFHAPDTVNGRFDMLVLHLWMVLRRLRQLPGGNALSQQLFDHFCVDMDDNLREMGVGDLTVPKRMQAFGEAFYGRSAAYDLALDAGGEGLTEALDRNILNSQDPNTAAQLSAYVMAALSALAGFDRDAFLKGGWRFPVPTPSSSLSR